MTIAKNREREDLALQAYGALKTRAREQKLMSYPELMAILGLHMLPQVGLVLKLVMDECVARCEPFYPALVVNREGQPGEGFYKQARALGHTIPLDPEHERAFWLGQLQRLGLHEAIFETENPEGTLWRENVSFLKTLGYSIEYKPLIGQTIPGRQLVEVIPRQPEMVEINPINAVLELNPQIREYLEQGVFRTDDKPGEDRLEAFRQLRKELQRIVYADVKNKVVENSRASRLPAGDDLATASQLPG